MLYKIGNVQIDASFYKDENIYSDGDIEEELLDIVKSKKDIIDILQNDNRWPVLYHLTPMRRNLLEWYDFFSEGSLLEIGGGCGALTGLFCEKLREVVVVESSKRRAEITANRYCDKENLKIIVGNFCDIKFERRFDYVTLIGVLEYTARFNSADDPYLDLLQKTRSLLSDSGKLIIAIENRFGLKYWAGAPEEHTGTLFEGIEGYLNIRDIRTFCKTELESILKKAGFSKIDFYYPYPDYKIPTQILSDFNIDGFLGIKGSATIYDNERACLFNESAVLRSMMDSGMFGFFSNSFLVFCSL